MIKVLIDARWIRSGQRGIGNFTSDLISAISLTNSENLKYVIAANYNTISNLKILYGSRFDYIKIPKLPDPILDFFYFSILNIIYRFNVIHFTGNSGFIFFKNKTKIVLTLHDVSFMKNFNIVPKPHRIKQLIGRKYRKTFVPFFINNSDEIVTVSNFAKNDILKEFPNISNIDFVYHGFKETNNNILHSRFINLNLFENKFLVISGNDPQKNLVSVIKAFSILYNKMQHNAPEVEVVGLSKEQFLKHNPNTILEPNIDFFGYLDNQNLKFAILKSKAVIIPSYYESFGLPIIESLFLRKRIICSNTGALSEIAKYSGVYFNPFDIHSLIECINVIDDFDMNRLDLWIEENKNNFSWQKVAEFYINKYHNLISH